MKRYVNLKSQAEDERRHLEKLLGLPEGYITAPEYGDGLPAFMPTCPDCGFPRFEGHRCPPRPKPVPS